MDLSLERILKLIDDHLSISVEDRLNIFMPLTVQSEAEIQHFVYSER